MRSPPVESGSSPSSQPADAARSASAAKSPPPLWAKTRHGIPSVESLKEAVMRSQVKVRKKSPLDQATTASNSPPPTDSSDVDPSKQPAAAAAAAVTAAAAAASTVSPSSTATRSKVASPGSAASSSSYPFPPMPLRTISTNSIGAAFSVAMSPSQGGPFDKPLPSGTTTPASFAFHPQGTQPLTPFENPDFPTPNMYELALLLHSEPGIEAFWSNVVKIATTCYKAERVTLAVPSDSTDLENTPWGQKATFNMAEDDALSLTYLSGDRGQVGDHEDDSSVTEDDDGHQGVAISETERASSFVPRDERDLDESTADTESDLELTDPVPIDPHTGNVFEPVTIGLHDPHSLDTGSGSDWISETSGPSPMDVPQPPPMPPEDDGRHGKSGEPGAKGRVFAKLQPLNCEPDALLDGSGVSRVLQRGKTVVLSREYRDVKTHLEEVEKRRKEAESTRTGSPETKSKCSTPGPSSTVGLGAGPGKLDMPTPGIGRPPSQPPTPLCFVAKGATRRKKKTNAENFTHNPVLQYYSTQQHLHHVQSRAHSPRRASAYEEYEQPVTSPWSQSPAPSPAPRPDPSENPFFALPKVDEDTFNPSTSSPVYSAQEPVNAIGCESSWTVIHIPLVHPSLSKGNQLDSHPSISADLAARGRSPFKGLGEDVRAQIGRKKSPIAILSMLSPVIPYPSNLIHSLSHFAPLVATSFALAQTHSSVLSQLVHLRSRHTPKRPNDIKHGFSYRSETIDSRDIAGYGSMTSPSEASSAVTGSSLASPAWDLGTSSAGGSEGVRLPSNPASPAIANHEADSYFSAVRDKRQAIFSRQTSGPIPTIGLLSKDSERFPTLEQRMANATSLAQRPTLKGKERSYYYADFGTTSVREQDERSDSVGEDSMKTPTAASTTPAQSKVEKTASSSDLPGQKRLRKRLRIKRPTLRPSRQPHTLLHSYGADYSTTFQSIPIEQFSRRVGGSSATGQNAHEMPPPSNKLLRTIIDSIPVHVFTAAPDTGLMTWVNARMLAFRGLSVEDFMKDPWESIHAEDRGDHMRRWNIAVRKGEPFSTQVRVRRFDGIYRWFMIRAVPLRDQRGIIVHWFGTNMDVHEQHIAEVNAARQAEMAESESKYRSLANSSPQIVFAATANDGITFANTQWLGYSGQTLQHALRLGFMENVHAADRDKCRLPGLGGGFVGSSTKATGFGPEWEVAEPPEGVDEDKSDEKAKRKDRKSKMKLEEDKPTWSTELRLKDKHGEYRWHLVRCVSVESNFGTGEGLWFGTCTDINDHKLLEQKLKEANDAAQKTMDSKTRFLANMSHEIRTPLIGISGMVNFLLDTPLNGEQLDYCHTISQSSDGLLSVINDILDLSKVEAGMMRLNPEWFRVVTLIEDAHELLSTMAIAKDLELNFVVEDDVPPVVCGDRVRLRQVLLNVIGNAIKFTTKGEVFSRCSVLSDAAVSEDEVMLQFECHDTGPGFDKKDEELMFKPFSQIDGSSTRAHGGSGLGLVISRQLVELHGGYLTASSEKGKGSTFVASAKFRLPKGKEEMLSHISTNDDPNLATAMRDLRPKNTQDILGSAQLTESPGCTPPGLTFGETPSTTASPASSAPSILSVPSIATSGSARSPTSSLQALPISPPGIDPASMQFTLPTDARQKYEEAYASKTRSRADTDDSTMDSTLGRAVTPPIFSILIVSEQPYSRIAIAHQIKVTLPKNVPHQITTVGQFDECRTLLGGDDPVVFTHVVINLPNHDEIIALLTQILDTPMHSVATVLVLTNPTQRTAIIQNASSQCNKLGARLHYIYKPIKPSRFGTIFDPANERDASLDRNRDSAQQVVESQKKVFSRLEHEVGNRGFKVLLVEDNRVNQKVLLRFLAKVGLEVETASDGEECVELVLKNPPGYYGLVLCDLHMPRKDGFQATAEIREWERENRAPPLPIVALSANVMSDVAERCQAAGFSKYVSKPVDFRELSNIIKELLSDTPSPSATNPEQKSALAETTVNPAIPIVAVKKEKEAEKKAQDAQKKEDEKSDGGK